MDIVRNSPYWFTRMMEFSDTSATETDMYECNRYEKVWVDYVNAVSEIKEPLYDMCFVYANKKYASKEETRRKLYATKEMMWREVQKEKLMVNHVTK